MDWYILLGEKKENEILCIGGIFLKQFWLIWGGIFEETINP